MSKFKKPIGTPVPGVERGEEIRDRRKKREIDKQKDKQYRNHDEPDKEMRDMTIPENIKEPNLNEPVVTYREKRT